MHTPRGEVHFHKDEHGLPFIDLTESGRKAARMLMQLSKDAHEGEKNKGKGADALSLVQTVRGNYKGYTQQEILKAREARRAQTMLGSPSEKDLQGLVSNTMIENCPFTSTDISNAKAIYGPDIAQKRGATVRRAPAPVVADYVAVPRSLVDANKC